MPVSETAVNMRWQWHPEIRERWAGERLYFWKLSFPTYQRSRVVEGLEEVMRQVGVQAYAVYELHGGYDILLRVWLPTTHRVFESTFRKVFHNDDIVIESLVVDEVVTHWPWAAEDGSMRRLDEEVLSARLPNSEIERINSGLALTEFSDHHSQGLIAPAWHTQGIKFIVLVGASRHPMATAAVDRLRGSLLKIVLDASDDAFAEKSIYRGLGFCAYLIIGRVRNESFHMIEREIIGPINEVISPETFGARTTTFTMATEDFVAFSEKMPLDEETPRKRSAAEWLEFDEGQHLEVKGSAFSRLKPWLETKDDAVPPLDDMVEDTLMKAIAGLLNAEGGAIVIGALETQRCEGSPRLEDAPRVGTYMVLGLHPEMRDRGWDWDKYERRLWDIVDSRFKGDPNPKQFLDLHRDGIGARPMCVLSVREPHRSPSSDTWFYHYPKDERHPRFWVREGNRTVEKIGAEIDRYKREKSQRATDPR
jgi:hypothetical protein